MQSKRPRRRIRDGQQAVRNAADAYARTLQTPIAELLNLPTTATLPEVTDVQATVDPLYNHIREVVEIQRGLAGELVTAAT